MTLNDKMISMRISKAKWRMIKRILRSDNSLVVSLEDGDFAYNVAGDDTMFNQLFQRLMTYIPKWHGAWLLNNRK